jgi:very-short-patch-repair endonuclease
MYRDANQRDFARELRNSASPAEERLWFFFKGGKLGVKFRRQAAIGPYIVDFVCFSQQLVVELDGPQHLEPDALEYDTLRTEWIVSEGFRVLRFRNHELDEDIRGVVERIEQALWETPLS